MTRRLVSVTESAEVIIIRGYKAHGLALGAGLRPTYNGAAAGWVLDAKHLPRFVAWCEYRHVEVQVIGQRDGQLCNALHSLEPQELFTDVNSSEQLDLFGGVG